MAINLNSAIGWLVGWFGYSGGAIAERQGKQLASPSSALVADASYLGPDGALQISTVWACVNLRASTIASLPFFVYQQKPNGQKELARLSRLYGLLHDSPNSRMTPFEFWRAMILNHDLRGNAYARIDRDNKGEAIALWPMPSDQVESYVLPDGSMVYLYRIGNDVAAIAEENVLHLKNLGNGTTGMAKLEFMNATINESAAAQRSASKIFGTGGKPTGVLMVDGTLKEGQREALRASFAEMQTGLTQRLYVLEANMKYQQLSISPEDQQLLETRKFSVEEICRWFDVPPVLVHHANVTTWGSGIEQIVDGFYKLVIRPMLVNIEQAVKKRVKTPAQRSTMTSEISFDALLRGSAKDRAELYAKNTQNGIMTRNECRQLENLPPMDGADELTAQSNLAPLHLLGVVQESAPKETNNDTAMLSSAIARLADKETTINVAAPSVKVDAPVVNVTVPERETTFNAHIHEKTSVKTIKTQRNDDGSLSAVIEG